MSDDNNIPIVEDTIQSSRYCYFCYTALDNNKACTNPDCPLYGIPQA